MGRRFLRVATAALLASLVAAMLSQSVTTAAAAPRHPAAATVADQRLIFPQWGPARPRARA